MLRKSFIILFTILSYGYSYTISGFVKDSSNGEPLPYTNVIIYIDNELGEIPDDINGAASDVNGYFIIPGISNGDYIIKAMVIGYDSNEQQLTVNSNLKVNFELSPTPIEGKEIKVSAERMRFEKKVDISRVNLTNRDIRRTPAFIESDVFRTLQLLPSVNASNDFNAALIVRGGSPDENLILLDGTEVYNPYHIGGIFSTFNSDMIADTEFLAGGFPANYGGRLSSVLTITAREGDSKNGRLQSKFPTIAKYWDYSKIRGDISLLSSKFSTEGKILNGSWMLSGRRTYFDKFVDAYYDSQDETPPANYYFWDTHFKVKMPLSQNNQLMYSQFSGKDDLFVSLGGGDFPGVEFNWDWGNGTKSLNWRYIPNGSYIVNTSLSQTKYNFDVGFEIDFQVAEIDSSGTDIIGNSTPDLTLTVDNLVEDYDLKQNLKYIYNEDLTFEAGWQIKNLNLDYREFFAGRETARLQSKPKIYSSFINTTFKPMPLFYINAGARTAKYNKYDKAMIDPKIGIKFNPTGNLALKFTIGQYSQFVYTINQ